MRPSRIGRMLTHLILGTAGHIDHGKTSLVRALTGTDTARLPEEKRRGITIDLGFAQLELGSYRLGIVDVPGHERFVRNMLAGATGMDLAMLVVAANDSVKPQTVEHLEILRQLDLPAGVIALTKADTADADWRELVVDEIRTLVAGTFLADAPIVATSVVTGEGLEELRAALAIAADRAATVRQRLVQRPARMPIDRTFQVPGHGLVVTGSLQTGEIVVGDELEIQPGGMRVRVRGLQSHDQPVQRVVRGQRAAVNLVGVKADQIGRGHELAATGHLQPTRLMTARLQLHPGARPMPARSRCRVHVGAAEFLASVRLLDTSHLAPGDTALAQIYLDRDAVAVWRQPMVLRSESPVTTIGGGIVVDPHARPLKRPTEAELQRLADWLDPDPHRRASAALSFAGTRPWQPADLSRSAGVEDPEAVVERLRREGVLVRVAVSPTRDVELHEDVLARLENRLLAVLGRLHDRNPLRLAFPQIEVAQKFGPRTEPAVRNFILERLVTRGQLRRIGSGVGLADRGPRLSRNEQKLLRQLIDWYREAGFEAPTVEELQARVAKNRDAVSQLIALGAENGDLVAIHDRYYLHADVDRATQQHLAQNWPTSGTATLSEIRELLGTSRKYAVPYCEYLDRIGFTIREGDFRKLAQPQGEAAKP